jgi:DNA-binding PadR family transcriptional regulator
MKDAQPVDLGRFAEPAVLVLASLTDGPKHGYAIMSDAESLGGARIGPGTLYAVLARLEQAGFIEPLQAVERRRPYRITPQGRAALGTRLEEMDRFVRLGRLRSVRRAGT